MTIPGRDDDQDAIGQLLLIALSAIVSVYEQAGVELPKRQYAYYGAVAADCEQLTVSLGQAYPGTPGADPSAVQACSGPRTVVLVIQLFRRIPVGSGPRGQAVPTAEQLTTSALGIARDVWLLMDAVEAVAAAARQKDVISDVTPVDTSGGFVGINVNLTMLVP